MPSVARHLELCANAMLGWCSKLGPADYGRSGSEPRGPPHTAIAWTLGGAVNLTMQGTAVAVGALSDDKEQGRQRREALSSAGTAIHDFATEGGKALGRGVAAVAKAVGKAGGSLGGAAAELAGASDENIRRARFAGNLVGAAGVGLVAGEVFIGGVVDAIGAVDGLSGAAAVAHGERVLGTLAGGGQAAGQAIEATVAAGSAVTTAADGNRAVQKEPEKTPGMLAAEKYLRNRGRLT